MRTKLKIMLVLSLLLLLIGCSKEKNDSQIVKESKVQKEETKEETKEEAKEKSVKTQKRISKADALDKYLEQGILEGYTETEILIEFFNTFFSEIREDAEPFKDTDYTYKKMDLYMKDFKSSPEYGEAIEGISEAGYNKKEAEIFLDSMTSIFIIYNDYLSDGIYLEKDVENIISKDERLQTHLRDMATVTRDAYNRSE